MLVPEPLGALMRRREFIAGLCYSAIATRTVSWLCAALLGACFYATPVAAADDPLAALNALQLPLEDLELKTRKRNEALKRVLDQVRLANLPRTGTRPAARTAAAGAGGGQTQSIDLRRALASYQQSQDLIARQLTDKLGQHRAEAGNTGGGDAHSSELARKAATLAELRSRIMAADVDTRALQSAAIDTMQTRQEKERDAAWLTFGNSMVAAGVSFGLGAAAGAGAGTGASAGKASGLRTLDSEDRALLLLAWIAAQQRKEAADTIDKIKENAEKKKAMRDLQAALRDGNSGALAKLLNNHDLGELHSAKHEYRLARLHAIVATDVALTNLLVAYAARAIQDPKNSPPPELRVLDVVQGLSEQSRAKAEQQRDAIKQMLELLKQADHALEQHDEEAKRSEGKKAERHKSLVRQREWAATRAALAVDLGKMAANLRRLNEQMEGLRDQIVKKAAEIEGKEQAAADAVERAKQAAGAAKNSKASIHNALERLRQLAALIEQSQARIDAVEFAKLMKERKNDIDALNDKIAEMKEQIQKLKAMMEKLQQVADKIKDLFPKFEQFMEAGSQTGSEELEALRVKGRYLERQAAVVQAKIAETEAALNAAAAKCLHAVAGGLGSPELQACQEADRLLAELEALRAQLAEIQAAIKEVLIAIAIAGSNAGKGEKQSIGRKKTKTAKRDFPRLTNCPPTCPGSEASKMAKPMAVSGGGSSGGSRLLSPSLLDGGGGLSGGNTTVRGLPAGGMTGSPSRAPAGIR
jgi:chromosome segregation ATPase